ncbi:hypothetical protein V9T40_004654 [Parthenolecanium corni]|uniref:Uncharacterized protein n=1 Tax=Parthenolecanium corni TaxID=536013 RepID=A0AAN9TE89_9HEMI
MFFSAPHSCEIYFSFALGCVHTRRLSPKIEEFAVFGEKINDGKEKNTKTPSWAKGDNVEHFHTSRRVAPRAAPIASIASIASIECDALWATASIEPSTIIGAYKAARVQTRQSAETDLVRSSSRISIAAFNGEKIWPRCGP